MSKKPETKKEKQRKKNLKDWRIFLQSKEQAEKVDIAAPEFVPPPPPPPKKKAEGEGEWMQKRETMRRSIDERRSQARDRWKNSSLSSGSGGARAR